MKRPSGAGISGAGSRTRSGAGASLPLEYLWSHLDRTDLANFAPDDLGELAAQVRRGARRVRRKADLSFTFLEHSGLYPEL